jgi:putative oxidoreductase
MRRLFTTDTKYLNNDLALVVGRVAIAALMLSHGLPKMQMLFSGDPILFPPVLGMSAGVSLSLAVFAEVVCSIFIFVGLGTRLAAVPLIIAMLVAVFSIHAADVFAKKELAVLYLAGYVVLFVAGSGKYSVDHLLQRKPQAGYRSQFEREDRTLSAY